MYNSLAYIGWQERCEWRGENALCFYASGVELCPKMHMGYVNFEVKHLVSLHFYNTHNFCTESSNDIKFVGGERLLDL